MYSNKYLLFLCFIKRPTNCWQSLPPEDWLLYVSSKRLHFDNYDFIFPLFLLDMICVSLHQPIGILKLQIWYITLDLLFWDNDCKEYCFLGFYTLYSTGRTTNFFGGPSAFRASLKMEAIVSFKKLVNCTRMHCFPSQMRVIFHITLCSENTDGATCNNFRILFFWNMILHHRVMDPGIARPYI